MRKRVFASLWRLWLSTLWSQPPSLSWGKRRLCSGEAGEGWTFGLSGSPHLIDARFIKHTQQMSPNQPRLGCMNTFWTVGMRGALWQPFPSLKIAARRYYKQLAALLASPPSLCSSRLCSLWSWPYGASPAAPSTDRRDSSRSAGRLWFERARPERRRQHSGILEHALRWLASLQRAGVGERTYCSHAAWRERSRPENMCLCKWRSYLPRSQERDKHRPLCTAEELGINQHGAEILLVDCRYVKIRDVTVCSHVFIPGEKYWNSEIWNWKCMLICRDEADGNFHLFWMQFDFIFSMKYLNTPLCWIQSVSGKHRKPFFMKCCNPLLH